MNPAEKITIQPAADEKVASVMVYMSGRLVWGEVIVKDSIRVSTWLRTNAAPELLTFYNAKILITTQSDNPRPILQSELSLFASQIIAYHLIPPQQDPVDYDPTEPNRIMEPVTVWADTFRMDGHMRLSAISSLKKYLDVTREIYTSLYNVDVSNPLIPDMGILKVPYIIVRQTSVLFAKR
ncbi:MAG: hypothetical protein AB1453_15095 [Chloroflexota bacterium]|jgi:hypothetical protein